MSLILFALKLLRFRRHPLTPPPRLGIFSGLYAFFSPTCCIATRAAFINNGGQIATAEEVSGGVLIHVYFVEKLWPTACEARLEALGMRLHDQSYVSQSLAHQTLLDPRDFRVRREFGTIQMTEDGLSEVEHESDGAASSRVSSLSGDGPSVEHSLLGPLTTRTPKPLRLAMPFDAKQPHSRGASLNIVSPSPSPQPEVEIEPDTFSSSSSTSNPTLRLHESTMAHQAEINQWLVNNFYKQPESEDGNHVIFADRNEGRRAEMLDRQLMNEPGWHERSFGWKYRRPTDDGERGTSVHDSDGSDDDSVPGPWDSGWSGENDSGNSLESKIDQRGSSLLDETIKEPTPRAEARSAIDRIETAELRSFCSTLSVPSTSSEEPLRIPIRELLKSAPSVLPWMTSGSSIRDGLKEMKVGHEGFDASRKGKRRDVDDGQEQVKKVKIEV